MKRYWPLIAIATGVMVLVAGFVYDVLFAGIPYQDPTPELRVRYAHHAYVASMISRIGGWILLAGLVMGLVYLVVRRVRRKRAARVGR